MPNWLIQQISRNDGGTHNSTGNTAAVTNRTSNVTGKTETVTQTQQPVSDESTAETVQEGESIKVTDAGVSISFSVTLLGGLYSEPGSNPPIS